MRQLLLDNKTGELSIAELADPTVHAGRVLIRTSWSAVSTGTERAAVVGASQNILRRAAKRPDQVRQVFESLRERGVRETLGRVQRTLNKTVPLGYCYAGVVEAVAPDVRDVSVGDRVAGVGWGQGAHAELLAAPRSLIVKVPAEVGLREAAFTGMGGIALEGVRKLEPQLGERVLVVGLGLIGLLAMQILRAAGCRVLGVDPQESKIRRARELGCDEAVVSTDPSLPARASAFTDGVGFDGALLTANATSSEPLVKAAEQCRVGGRIVVTGTVDVSISRDLLYTKELDVRISRAFGPGSYDQQYTYDGTDYPIEMVRWPLNRNLAEFVHLLATGRVQVGPLVTHELTLAETVELYDRMQVGSDEYVGVAIRYAETRPESRPIARRRPAGTLSGQLGLGFIGAGSFARGVLLPAIAHDKQVKLIGLVNSSPVTAHAMASEFDFEYSGTDTSKLLADERVRCVFISTRHASHARLVCDALAAGKDVFVEKPLALSDAELDELERVHAEHPGLVMVDFNRRFAPLVTRASAFFSGRRTPMVIQYRVNAGSVPVDNWVQDPKVGGGRILGEVCHFVDTIQYFTGASITRTGAVGVRAREGAALTWDNVIATLELADGSIATIAYAAGGHESREIPKERIELFAMAGSAVIDGFRELTCTRAGSVVHEKLRRPEQGHAEAVHEFLAAVRGRREAPISFEKLINSSRATVRIHDALNLGQSLSVDPATQAS